MDLKNAIKETLKVIPRITAKNRATENYCYLKFQPKTENRSARIYGTDGGRFFVAPVGEDYPIIPALAHSDLLAKAARDPNDLQLRNLGYGSFELYGGDQNIYRFISANNNDFPNLPEIPPEDDFQVAAIWPIPAVLHAAAKPTEEAQLSVVRFCPRFVEAMALNRVARVWLVDDWNALVQADLFNATPKGQVRWCFTETHVFFYFGECLRIAPRKMGEYPNTEAIIPAQHQGPFALAPIDPLLVAIKQGTAVSELSLVHLLFSPEQIRIRAWIEGDVAEVYEATVPIFHGSGQEGQLLVGGKPLYDALKPIKTPNVLLGYGGLQEPLRIESGPYVACLWQMVY